MRKLTVLGNCVAERLGLALEKTLAHLNLRLQPRDRWQPVLVPPVYNRGRGELAQMAAAAGECDIVFSQPLFNFGPCNTAELRTTLGDRLHTFSAPNFEAYFPDVLETGEPAEKQKSAPPLEWHSKIILQCKASRISVEEVEDVYLNHPLFHQFSMHRSLAQCWQKYEKREQGVTIGTLAETRKYFATEPLFHTFNHPADRLMKHILAGMLAVAGFSETDIKDGLGQLHFQDDVLNYGLWTDWGFGFNAWPIITRHHKYFSFPGREWFRIGGRRVDITTVAIAWYNYYDAHPANFRQAMDALAQKYS